MCGPCGEGRRHGQPPTGSDVSGPEAGKSLQPVGGVHVDVVAALGVAPPGSAGLVLPVAAVPPRDLSDRQGQPCQRHGAGVEVLRKDGGELSVQDADAGVVVVG